VLISNFYWRPQCPVCKADVTKPDHPYPDHDLNRPEHETSAINVNADATSISQVEDQTVPPFLDSGAYSTESTSNERTPLLSQQAGVRTQALERRCER
jgi:hypothetical protein